MVKPRTKTKLQLYSMKLPEWLIYRLNYLLNKRIIATSRSEAIRLAIHLLARDFYTTREVLREIPVTNGDEKLKFSLDHTISYHLPDGIVNMIEQFVDERDKLLFERGVEPEERRKRTINSFSVIVRYAVYRWVTFWEDRCGINSAKYCYDCKEDMVEIVEEFVMMKEHDEINETGEWIKCPECENTRLLIHH